MIEKKNITLLISVITVSYNSEKTIRDTIESVLNQTYNNLEYIIVDGESIDSTLNIIKSYEQQFKEKNIKYTWISEPDKGIYDAMNKGITLASGELIGILNSDDWYTKKAISEVVKTNYGNKFSIISGEMQKVNFDKTLYKVRYNKNKIHKYIYKTMPLNHPATFVHKNVYKKIGCFDTKYKLSADYDLIFRAYNANVNFIFIDKVIVNMRNSGVTGQLKSLAVTAKEDQHIRKKNNVKLSNLFYLKRIGFNFLVIIRNFFK